MFRKILFIVLLLFLFSLGLGTGFFLKPNKNVLIQSQPETGGSPAQCVVDLEKETAATLENERLALKLDLLKDYLNFTLLPAASITDPEQYAQNMRVKIEAIGEDELTVRYNTSGEIENKDQKILDLFSYLIEDIKKGILER